MALKYIMVQQGEVLFPVLFPAAFVHRDVAAQLDLPDVGKLRSAGFVRLVPGERSTVEANGYSRSLHLGSHADDGRIIAGWLEG